jgi:hypothetical protein
MNKIDLIVEALKYAKDCGNLRETEVIDNALTAARELQKLKPVAFCALTPNGMMGYFDGKPMIMVGKIGNDCHTTPLYALDEVTK